MFGKYASGVPYNSIESIVSVYSSEVNADAYPVIGVDCATRLRHIARRGHVTWPEPHLHKFLVALHGVDSTADRVEACAVRVLDARGLNTTTVVTLTVEVAGTADHATTVVGHSTARISMERDLVVNVVVDAFDLCP